mgnify:CR=1 FL=1
MSVDSINYGRELRNIFAEIKSLRAEIGDMQSALLSVQEQYGYAVVELLNRSNEFDKKISEIKSQLQNSVEISQQKFKDLKTQNEKLATQRMKKLNSVHEKFLQFEKHLADNSEKFNSRLDILSQQNEITNKNLSALEELLRLIAANQLLDEVESNFCNDKNNFRDTKIADDNFDLITSDEMYKRGMDYFEDRNGYNKNKTYAFKLFMDAANLGHVRAMQKISECYRYGWGIVQDEYQARIWYQKYLQVM